MSIERSKHRRQDEVKWKKKSSPVSLTGTQRLKRAVLTKEKIKLLLKGSSRTCRKSWFCDE